jgi:hypothetical protein
LIFSQSETLLVTLSGLLKKQISRSTSNDVLICTPNLLKFSQSSNKVPDPPKGLCGTFPVPGNALDESPTVGPSGSLGDVLATFWLLNLFL